MLPPRAALIFSKIDVLEKKWCQDASWGDLGSLWVAKGGPRRGLLETKLGSKRGRKSEAKKGLVLGGQKGPKRHQKRDQNDTEIVIDFWTDFGPILEAQEIE